MKNKPLTITLIVILSVIIFALVGFMILTLTGTVDAVLGFGQTTKVVYDQTYPVGEITNLEILSKTGDIEIKPSTTDKIRVVVKGNDKKEVDVKVSKETLKIEYQKKSKLCIGFCFGMGNEITVYVPEQVLKGVSISSKYGDIETMDLEYARVDIDADCGDVSLGEVKRLKADLSYGNIDVKKVTEYVDIDASCGDITIEEMTLTQDSKLDDSYGNIEIEKASNIYIDAHTSMGNVDVSKNDRKAKVTLKIDASLGDIKVN